jgi:glycerophosphoryl diester phosphodiesterase
MAMAGLDWLTARPVAHRGLHDASEGIIENTPSAFIAAITAGYGIECDLQISADGEAMVHHDATLGRMTGCNARLDTMTAAELKRVPFAATSDRMITLGELCELTAGRASLVIELKSRFDGDLRLVSRAIQVLAGYRGAVALMSFDPALVAALRAQGSALPRGMVAEASYQHSDWEPLPSARKRSMTAFTHVLRTRPQFIAYAVDDLPAVIPRVARGLFRLPLLTWVVRNARDREKASHYADQMIFEGFRP